MDFVIQLYPVYNILNPTLGKKYQTPSSSPLFFRLTLPPSLLPHPLSSSVSPFLSLFFPPYLPLPSPFPPPSLIPPSLPLPFLSSPPLLTHSPSFPPSLHLLISSPPLPFPLLPLSSLIPSLFLSRPAFLSQEWGPTSRMDTVHAPDDPRWPIRSKESFLHHCMFLVSSQSHHSHLTFISLLHHYTFPIFLFHTHPITIYLPHHSTNSTTVTNSSGSSLTQTLQQLMATTRGSTQPNGGPPTIPTSTS